MSLAQYYTASRYSAEVVAGLSSSHAETVIDIGCGTSNLLLEASRRWGNAKLIGLDIDPKNLNASNRNLTLKMGNGLDPDLYKKIVQQYGHIDVALSNPPYLIVEHNKHTKALLKDSGLDQAISRNLEYIPAEVVFLAQNLLVTKVDAELGLILPAGLVSGERWKGLREYLCSEHLIKSCSQLPPNSFSNTEASTFILVIKKGGSSSDNVKIKQTDSTKIKRISYIEAKNRMDFDFYNSIHINGTNLGELIDPVEIFRGNISHKGAKNLGCDYIHTSNVFEKYCSLVLKKSTLPKGLRHARAGDLVICRVGTRCVGRIAYIKSGHAVVTDCMIVVRTKNTRDDIIDFMKANSASEIFIDMALGVSAKYITKSIVKRVFSNEQF